MAKNSVGKGRSQHFEEIALSHLNAAYNPARWLTRNEHDADDVVQESYMRALASFDTSKWGATAAPGC